jgi:hypothetical protein
MAPVRGVQPVCKCVHICGASVGEVWDECGVLSEQLTTANDAVATYRLTQNMGLEYAPIPTYWMVSPQGLEP